MYHVRRSGRAQHKAKARSKQSLQKPNGVISPRVQKVGGEHFAIVCVDPAKHRSEWMMADYFGNLMSTLVTCRFEASLRVTHESPKFEPPEFSCADNDTNWTWAEVKACCRLAALLDMSLVQAAQNIVPVAVTSAESVERLRSWASGRCLSADKPGIYKFTSSNGKSCRKIPRDPSLN